MTDPATASVEAVAPLFVPSLQDRKYDKAAAMPGQVVILDLEDAVADQDKTAARAWLAERPPAQRHRTWARVNDVRTGRTEQDVRATAAVTSTVLLPKCESGSDVEQVASWLADEGSDASVAALVETTLGLTRLAEITAAAPGRLRRLFLGLGDLTTDLGVPWDGLGPVAQHARVQVAVASRAAGLLPPIDSVFPDVADLDGLRAESAAGRACGYSGKACIHPTQLKVVTAAFAPSGAEVAHAQRTHTAYAAALADGHGAVLVDGVLVDYPVALAAQAVLIRAGVPHEPLGREAGYRS